MFSLNRSQNKYEYMTVEKPENIDEIITGLHNSVSARGA